MKTTWVLAIIYVIIIVAVFLFLHKFRTRGFSRRVLSDISKCPFGTRKFFEYSREGGRPDREGIVSYSLYGKYDRYYPSLRRQLIDIPRLMETWQAVVYTPIDVPAHIASEIVSLGGELVILKGTDTIEGGVLGHEAALWRFLSASQTLPFVCLDADDEFDPKLVPKIHKWLKSGSQFFIFSPINAWIPMMAGRWGARGAPIKAERDQQVLYGHRQGSHHLEPPVPDMLERMNHYCENWFGFDEAFLKKEIWPLVRKTNFFQTRHWPLTDLLVVGIILAFIGGVIALVASRAKDRALENCLAGR
jgi:hypothetical protein